ncbi:MAG: chromate transporter, partial [Dongiaceae bacterium]
ERKWISDSDYKEGLALSQLMPGPLAAQLAIYLGYVHYGVRGATLVGTAFVLPSFLMVLGLGWLYQAYGGLDWMQAVFYGVGAAVIGVIALSAHKLTTKNLGRDKLLWAIAIVSAAITVATASELVWAFVIGGLLVWFVRCPPKWLRSGSLPAALAALTPAAAAPLDWSPLTQIALFFAKAGAFVFGSGLAIVPFLYGGTVLEHQWLSEREFVDAVAVAMITPGPVVITVGFIGYLVEGVPGAIVAALATFLPCYLFTIIPAPYFKKHGKRPAIVAFVDGATAAAVGTIAGAVIVLGQRAVIDLPTAALALGSVAVLWRFKKLPEPVVIVVAAVIGLFVHPLMA